MCGRLGQERVCEGRASLLVASEAPSFSIEETIKTGYRPQMGYQECLGSIFRLHNETVNIWTHLLGFLFFFNLFCRNIITAQPHQRDWPDVAATLLQLLCYQLGLLASSLFHTFLCHSQEAKQLWLGCDQAGILLSLFGTYVRIIVTLFHCLPLHASLHVTIVCVLFGTVAFCKLGARARGKKSSMTTILFIAISLYAAVPIGHWVYLRAGPQVPLSSLWWLLAPYLLGALGLLAYLSRVPEVLLKPGTVDLCGASHQIWHILIFSGMVSWYYLASWLARESSLSCLA